jgi:hypothetical protein
MDPKDLVKIWGAPDNTKLTPKQISIRLPIHVAAKIFAISEMFPKKKKTEIIGDLLAAALAQFAEGLPNEPSEYEEAQGRDPQTEWCGERGTYERKVKKYLDEFDREETGTEEK